MKKKKEMSKVVVFFQVKGVCTWKNETQTNNKQMACEKKS
jgi:hypothetical protein